MRKSYLTAVNNDEIYSHFNIKINGLSWSDIFTKTWDISDAGSSVQPEPEEIIGPTSVTVQYPYLELDVSCLPEGVDIYYSFNNHDWIKLTALYQPFHDWPTSGIFNRLESVYQSGNAIIPITSISQTRIYFKGNLPVTGIQTGGLGIGTIIYDAEQYYSPVRSKPNGVTVDLSGDMADLFVTTQVAPYCSRIFTGWSGIYFDSIEKLILPWTTLSSHCYENMFIGKNAGSWLGSKPPKLLATTLAEGCYYRMFYGNKFIDTLPELPATVLAKDCYKEMFGYCNEIKMSLTQDSTYKNNYMIPINGNGIDATDALKDMFIGTGGTFKSTPTINTTYYTSNDINKRGR